MRYKSILPENELRRFDMLLALFDNNNTDVCILNGDGVYVAASESYADHNGLNLDDVIGTNIRDLADKGVFSPSVSLKVLEKKKKCTLVQKNWLGRTIMATGAPLFDDKGNIEYVITYNSIDIAETTTTEDKIQRLKDLMRAFNISANELSRSFTNKKFTSRNTKMLHIINLMDQIADTTANVVLTGETGVGKSFAARYIHDESSRKDKPFVEVDCSSIPKTLFESELFGYEAGAFTGANATGKPGKIETANGGTLFLDEIGDMPLDMQVKLLKAIQEKQIVKVGGLKPINVDFRLIVATNKDLAAEVQNGNFREDLYYRLLVIPIELPPLRERPEDISILADMFMDRFNKLYNRQTFLNTDAVILLESLEWPGNIRELENAIERLVILCNDNIISHNDVASLTNRSLKVRYDNSTSKPSTLNSMLDSYEAHIIRSYYKQYHTSVEVAKQLGISQPTAARRIQKYIQDDEE